MGMGCEMTLNDVITALLDETSLGKPRGAFPEHILARAKNILRRDGLRNNRILAAAGIIDGFRRGNRYELVRQLRAYWDEHLEPEPEWVEVKADGGKVYGPDCVFVRPDGPQTALVDAQSHQYRIRLVTPCCSARPSYLKVEVRRIDGGDD